MITVNTLLSGIGAQVAAFKRLNIPYKVIGISEIDKFAVQSYEAINGPTRNYGDITQIPYLDYADLWTYSSPCFTHDSLVLTEKNGYKQITNLQIGESVLTHDGTYKTVENVINNGMKKTVKVYGMGVDEIHTTPNHLFYVREKSHIWNCKTRSYTRVFSKPIWKQADSLKRTDYKCPHCYSDGYRIRKLTARECWRLMGFTDIEFECAQISGVSNSQLYRQAGNSIVVDVLVAIFKELLK